MLTRLQGQEGVALVTVLVLVIVLTAMGVAMVDLVLTETAIAYNQGDAIAAQFAAEGGIARALYELSLNAAWPGITDTLGDGQYQVTVTSSGTMRTIVSVGTRSGARQILNAAVKVLPRFAVNGLVGNTTVTLGGAQAGLTVENVLPSDEAGALHANNRLGAATAATINPAGANVIGAVTANGTISGVTCATWPWRCDALFGTIGFPRLDMDSADPASYRSRATTTTDLLDGLNLFFRGGDAASRCSAPGWNFGPRETQRCWDRYVNDRGGNIGAAISNAVFYVQFNASERTQYALSTSTITHRGSLGGDNNGATTLTITRPAGVVLNDVMVAAISVRGGSGTAITSVPAGWTLVPGGTNPIDNGTTLKMAVYYKVATAAEPADYTWGFSSSEKASGGIQAYANVDTAGPIDVALGQTTPSGTDHSTPSITTTLDGAMLVASFAAANGATWIPQTPGLDERYDEASGGGPQSTRTTSEGTDQLQATGGATGVKTSRTGNAAVGITHILALVPRRVTVDCVGLAPGTTETLCLRSRPATDSNSVILYAASDPRQVTGMIAVFRRVAGTAVAGGINFENVSLRTANYTQQSLTGDPALVAGGQIRLVSSGFPAAPRDVDLAGFVYAFAGLDNPVGGCVPPSTCPNDLLGSAGSGIDMQHGANQVNVILRGVVMSNGAAQVVDAAANVGTIVVRYDSAVTDILPVAFMPQATGNVLLGVSWSAKD